VLCYAKNLYNDNGSKKELLVEYEKTDFEDAPLYNASNPENILEFPKGCVKFNISDGIYKKTNDKKYKLLNEVIVENGKNKNAFKLKFNSRWSAKTILEETKKGTTYWVKSENFAIRAIYAGGKIFNESPKQMIFTNAKNEFVAKINQKVKVGTNEDGSSVLKDIIGDDLFGYPKSTTLIQYLVNLIKLNNAIILDFFAGSGTTGQAVLELNKEDGGKRQFILVTDNEITETTPNGIVNDVTSKRLKRVMTGQCFDGTKNYKWIEKNASLGDNLDVYDIATVAPFSDEPFEKIDETLYGKAKLGVNEKIKWICENFEGTQKKLEIK